MNCEEFKKTKLGNDALRIYPAWDLAKVETALGDIARLKPSEIKERRMISLKEKLFQEILGMSETDACIESNDMTRQDAKRLSHIINCMWSNRLTEWTFAEAERG